MNTHVLIHGFLSCLGVLIYSDQDHGENVIETLT